MTIRNIIVQDQQALIRLAASTQTFQEGEAEELLGGVLLQYFAGELDQEHAMVALEDDESTLLGWSYYAPSQYSPGVWDVWWIGIVPKCHGQGHGTTLLNYIESQIAQQKGRVIVIETSSTPPMQTARHFYLQRGYSQCGIVPQFYGPADDKIIFSKVLR